MFSGVEKAAIGRFSSTGTWLGTFLGDLLGTSPGELLGTSLGETALSDPSLFPDDLGISGAFWDYQELWTTCTTRRMKTS